MVYVREKKLPEKEKKKNARDFYVKRRPFSQFHQIQQKNRLNTRCPKKHIEYFYEACMVTRGGYMRQNKPQIINIGQAVRERDPF